MKVLKKIVFLSTIMSMVSLPSFANFNGIVYKSHFYDTEKTIMTEVPLSKTLKTGKYWDQNIFYFNKYRPIFMLSNKDLYDLMPKQNISVVQRINTPAVYNISLKTASIKTISLVQPNTEKKLEKTSEKVAEKIVTQNKPNSQNIIAAKNPTNNTNYFSIYEQAKNPGTESETKVDTAILLKNSKDLSNYKLAFDLLDDVTREEPYNAYAFYIKGELYAQKKDYTNAMKNYVESLKINPTNKQCCLGIAKILENTNKELAHKYYDRAMLLSET